MPAERAFWLLCVIVESLQPPDFYAAGGGATAAMHGFEVAIEVIRLYM
jgi:hypothetical protein